MQGIDTNIVLRLLLRDDPGQVAIVDDLVARGNLLVSFTVLAEAEWVLRAVYELDRPTIAHLLGALVLIEGVVVADRDGLFWACERYLGGADFTDMIHLVASEGRTFLTFDRDLVRHAGDTAPSPAQLAR